MEAVRGRKLPRPQYVEIPVAQIDGMEALFPENNLRQLLVLNLDQELTAFEAVDIDAASSSILSHWSKWAGGIASTLERATASVEAGRKLLRSKNLEPLKHFVRDSEAAERIRKYVRSLPDA